MGAAPRTDGHPRPSVPVPPRPRASARAARQGPLPEWGQGAPEPGPERRGNDSPFLLPLARGAAAWLAQQTGWVLFGFDVLVESGSGDHWIVDLNYFPSYKALHFPSPSPPTQGTAAASPRGPLVWEAPEQPWGLAAAA